MEEESKSYYILDNRDLNFKVTVKENKAFVYKPANETKFLDKPFIIFTFDEIFIGHSIAGDLSRVDTTSESTIGNSILLRCNQKYIFISLKILQFEALSKIIDYRSPIGNNLVPYPFAIDEKNNYYLILSKTILLNHKVVMDPYNDFFTNGANLPQVPLEKTLIEKRPDVRTKIAWFELEERKITW